MATTSLDLTDLWVCPRCGCEVIPERQTCARCKYQKPAPQISPTKQSKVYYWASPSQMANLSTYVIFLPLAIFLIFLGFFAKILWVALILLIGFLYYSTREKEEEQRYIRISRQFLEYHHHSHLIRTTWGNVKSVEAIPAHINIAFHQPTGTGSYYEGLPARNNRPLRSDISIYLQDYSNHIELRRDILARYQDSKEQDKANEM
jgi:hypothetical protein